MLLAIHIISKNTFKEVIRDRVLYILLMFALLLLGLSFAVGQLSYEEIFFLSVSLGLSSIHLCFCGLTIFIGASLFFREIEQKTIYTLLVRPIERWQYLVGKYLGLLGVLVVLLIGFMACFSLIQLLLNLPFKTTTFIPFLGILLEAIVLLAATFFFSSFCTPYVAIASSISLFLVGHWITNLETMVAKSQSPFFVTVGNTIIYSFPNLGVLNWRDNALAETMISSLDLRYSLLLCFAWSFVFFALSQLIFSRRNFE